MNRPWKWSDVDWLPKEFWTLIITLSPRVTSMMGSGHWPLMPITGLFACPSGFAVTQLMSKSCVTVPAHEREIRDQTRGRK